jgi:cytochrome c
MAALLAAAAHSAPAADRALGEALYPERCGHCHALAPSEKPFQGPRLDRLKGRIAGSLDGFDYSLALEKAGRAGLIWDAAKLDAYLADPQSVVPGTFMAAPKLTTEERAAVIAFLVDWK